MNEGVLKPIKVYAPKGSLVNPKKPAPVSGGNLETSQRIADVVFKAIAQALPDRVPAFFIKTMNVGEGLVPSLGDSGCKKEAVMLETRIIGGRNLVTTKP